jgi:hypothetical protein
MLQKTLNLNLEKKITFYKTKELKNFLIIHF